jgi:competence protein ComEC
LTSLASRFAVLAGISAGLALSPVAPEIARASPTPVLAAALIGGGALAVVRPPGGRVGPIQVALVALAACLGGLGVGAMRLAAIDGGAFDGPIGRAATARGFVTAVPRRADGEVAVRIRTADGRLAVEGHEPVPDLPIGSEVIATGVLHSPPPWQADYLARYGIREVLRADRIRLTANRRGGVEGIVDGIRARADAALERGTPDPEAALLRGFLLGEDDRIDPATVDDFKRSGLAHLLAVSGDCVMLLALLGGWLLGLAGVSLRARLVALLALIVVYVPVAGASPSIQRAGIMGAAGVVAMLAGRPRWRWYAVLLATALTLLLNPRSVGDPSWQLSFAAVIGILLFAARIRDLILASPARSRQGRTHPHGPSPAGRVLAEGAGVTVAATLTTAPLFAHHFGAVSLASLPANLLALPAIAPMMWLGMLASILGQVPGVPVEPVTALAGLLAAYVAQIAHWLAAPGWSQVGIDLVTWPEVAAAYGVLGISMATAGARARRRRGAGIPRRGVQMALLAIAATAACIALGGGSAPGSGDPVAGLRIVVLDVGQGDSILLDPDDGDPILVDGGPPGDDLAEHLEDEGVSRLAAAVVTHDQSDHVGGINELLYDGFPIHRLVYSRPAPDFLRAARVAHVRALEVAEGSELKSGSLRLEVEWPPRDAPKAQATDPNQAALVVLARWHSFSMLLSADAEAEAVPLDPGRVDVLKVAHHGSDDAGLDALLDRTLPRLAVISVGADNPYEHPTPQTLDTLAEHGVPTLRTDQSGDVTIEVARGGWRVESG